jgi:dihydroorotase
MKLLIKNGRVIDPDSQIDETLDILIDKNKIADIKTKLSAPSAKIIDAAELVVAPGFIDMHVHLREPGQEHKETIRTGSAAAARGGFTSIACMPNTFPVIDNSGTIKYVLSEAKKTGMVNIFPIAAITKGQKGEELSEMAELLDSGAVAFSDDGNPVSNSQVMRIALEYVKKFDGVIINHCENTDLSENGVMNEGPYSCQLGLNGIPASSEEVMVARDIILAEKSGARIHLAHLSTKGSIELLTAAKAKKLKVTAEVTPHHLILDDSYLVNYDTNLKVNPPLRDKKDVSSLIKAVKSGLIDVIATDHAPHSLDEKAVEFDIAPFGINGLETAVSLLLDRLINNNIISLQRLIEMCSTNPAKILKLKNKGKICPGADADLTILDLNKKIQVDVNKFRSKSKNSPFHDWKLKGAPAITVVGGNIIYSNRSI